MFDNIKKFSKKDATLHDAVDVKNVFDNFLSLLKLQILNKQSIIEKKGKLYQMC